MLEFLHPDDAEIALVAVEAMQSKDVGTLLEVRIRAADGWRLVEARGTSFGDDILLSVRDITDRRRWEVAGDEVAEFRALIQNAASITMVLERERRDPVVVVGGDQAVGPRSGTARGASRSRAS